MGEGEENRRRGWGKEKRIGGGDGGRRRGYIGGGGEESWEIIRPFNRHIYSHLALWIDSTMNRQYECPQSLVPSR